MRRIKQFIEFLLDMVLPRPDIDTISTESFLEKTKNAYLENFDGLDDSSFAIFLYKNPLVRKAIWALKYNCSHHAANLLAKAIYPFIIDLVSEAIALHTSGKIYIVPVPSTPKHEHERGCDHVKLLIQAIEKVDTQKVLTPLLAVLVKTKTSPRQTETKTRRQRLENVLGTFSITESSKLENATVVLLDDVLTTGSTLREARRTVLRSGARSVICVAIAH